MSANNPTVLRLPRPWFARILGTGDLGVLGLFGPPLVVVAIAIGIEQMMRLQTLIFFVAAAVSCLILLRNLSVAVELRDDGIVIRNFFSTTQLSWAAVESIELTVVSTGRGQWPAPVLRTKEQTTIPLRAAVCCGRRTRLAQLQVLSPYLQTHGVPVITADAGPWRGSERALSM